jgi:hypothetical protein
LKSIKHQLQRPISIAPLIIYRLLFGLMLGYGCLWSIYKGDIETRYLEPSFFFTYSGFEWLPFVGAEGIYILYGIWFFSAVGIVLGAFYRTAIWSFFFAFTYLHLLDATNYINHYYAISIFAFFLACLPAQAAYSIDAWRKPSIRQFQIPYWQIAIFQGQVALIYLFAALAKMNLDWMLGAMPLKIWLLQSQDFPVLGNLFGYHTTHLFMSWMGLLFDLTIVFWLRFSKTRKWAYLAVVIFHTTTGLLFNIGLFPILMIFSTVVFFDPLSQQKTLEKLGAKWCESKAKLTSSWLPYFFIVHFVVQVFLPLRHHFFYDGNILWTEEGARFSWRVMLLEKEGMATFYLEDPNSERHWVVSNLEFLTPFQEKRMSIRPDHILQFAHHVAAIYARRYDIEKPIVRAEVYVAMNGRVSQSLIDSKVNLAEEPRSIWQKDWILPYSEK